MLYLNTGWCNRDHHQSCSSSSSMEVCHSDLPQLLWYLSTPATLLQFHIPIDWSLDCRMYQMSPDDILLDWGLVEHLYRYIFRLNCMLLYLKFGCCNRDDHDGNSSMEDRHSNLLQMSRYLATPTSLLQLHILIDWSLVHRIYQMTPDDTGLEKVI